jgi:peroxiredoxin
MTTLVLLLLILILVSLWIGFYALVKQQGRILLRLDQLEQNGKLAANGREDATEEPEGLPLSTDFPAFQLPDLTGRMVALADFRGRRVLLVQWNFQCGFCESIAPELARLETGFKKRNIQLLLLAYGDAASNRQGAAEYGLNCPILLLGKEETLGPFMNQGTPVAYLLDEESRVAAPFASGADRVLFLAEEAANMETRSADLSFRSAARLGDWERASEAQSEIRNPKSKIARSVPRPHRVRLPGFRVESEIGLGDVIKRVTSAVGIKTCVGCERRAAALNRWMVFARGGRGGLKAGMRAPLFHLPDLQGGMVPLEAYRGRRVLLVFTDPQCGPCDELAPHLVQLHQEHANNGLALIVVGRGDPEENRHKAKLHGFQFPVVLQEKWKLSKQYGTLATPVAFLIGEDGVIAKDVAVGKDAIVSVARDAAAQRIGELK